MMLSQSDTSASTPSGNESEITQQQQRQQTPNPVVPISVTSSSSDTNNSSSKKYDVLDLEEDEHHHRPATVNDINVNRDHSTLDQAGPASRGPSFSTSSSSSSTVAAAVCEDSNMDPDNTGSWLYGCNRPAWFQVVLLVILIACGVFEGFAFSRVGIIAPAAFYGQMVFRVWIVMKLFFAAIGASCLVQAIMHLIAPHFFNRTRECKYMRFGWLRTGLGGFLLGVGTTLSSTGPTMLPAMLGYGVDAGYVVIGYIAAGFAFALLDRFYFSNNEAKVEPEDKLVLDDWLDIAYWKVSLAMGVFAFAAACVLEFAIEPTGRLADQARLGMGVIAWPAVSAGVVIGFNQLVYRVIGHHGQGGSASIMVVISLVTWGGLAPKHFPNKWRNVWQIFFLWLGTPLGALAAVKIHGDESPVPVGVHPAYQVVGGFLSMFGARIAGACICGHSITNVSAMSFEGIVMTMGLFAGAIPTAFVMQAITS